MYRAKVVAVLAFAVALALPPASHAANPQFCEGSVTAIKADTERDTGANYQFTCRAPITGFAFVDTAEISGFDVSADVFDSPGQGGNLRGDDRFGECEGDIPSFGFICNGTYGALGRIVKGSFDGSASPCVRDASRHLSARYSIVVVNTGGKVAGPYELGRTKGCPKPAKKAKKHTKHKKPKS